MSLNTTQKGNILEERLYNYIEKLLEANEFWANNKFSSLYRHKGYFSLRRRCNIITDVSVEVCPIKDQKYTQLFIFECKNYKGTIPISDIEEFATKLTQISNNGFNVKGILVCTSNFTKAGVELAKSFGIALIRMTEEESFDYVATRVTPEFGLNQDINYFLTEYPIDKNLVCIDKDRFFYDLRSLFFCMLNLKLKDDDITTKIIIPFIPDEDLKDQSEALLRKYSPIIFEIIQPTPLEQICASLRLKEGVLFCFDKDLGHKMEQEILGKIDFTSSTIFISSKLKENSDRWRFTLAHEIGHFILHKSFFLIKKELTDTNLTINGYCRDKNEERMEIQANKFAVNLLMPAFPFEVLVRQRFLFDNINKNVLYVDNQYVNMSKLHLIVKYISTYLLVSKQVARYRLKELGFLIEANQPKRIKDYLS